MAESVDRDALLRMLSQGIPQPDSPNRRLTLSSVEEVKAADPNKAGDFAKRRGALFRDFLALRDRITHLDDREFSRLGILNMLFGDGSCTVGECWQQVHVARTANALHAFNTAVSEVIASGCVLVQEL